MLCTNVLVYFPKALRELALLNLRRVTKRGGFLVCTDALVDKAGENYCGWRFDATARHADFDPQYAFACLKAR